MSDVAVLGTGIMGAPMALNLARAGFGVRVWNRTPERAEPLAGELEVVSDHERAVSGAAYAQLKGKAMIARSFEPAFPLAHAGKDAALVIEAARASGARAPLAEVVKEQFDAAVAGGHGDEDLAAALYAYKGDR